MSRRHEVRAEIERALSRVCDRWRALHPLVRPDSHIDEDLVILQVSISTVPNSALYCSFQWSGMTLARVATLIDQLDRSGHEQLTIKIAQHFL